MIVKREDAEGGPDLPGPAGLPFNTGGGCRLCLCGKTRIDHVGQRIEEFVGHRPDLVESEFALRVRVDGDRVENRTPVTGEGSLRPENLRIDHAAVERGELLRELLDPPRHNTAAIHQARDFHT